MYYWARLFSKQLRKGQNYTDLKPVISIWLFENNVIPKKESELHHHRFLFNDPKNGIELVPKGAEIHLIELAKWNKVYQEKQKLEKDEDQWFWLFSESEKELDVDNPPKFMKEGPMKHALETIRRFGEEERARMLYDLRLDHQRLERQKEKDRLDALEKLKAAIDAKLKAEQKAEKERKRAEKEKADKLKAQQKAEKERKRAEKEKNEKLQALKRIKEFEQLLNR